MPYMIWISPVARELFRYRYNANNIRSEAIISYLLYGYQHDLKNAVLLNIKADHRQGKNCLEAVNHGVTDINM